MEAMMGHIARTTNHEVDQEADFAVRLPTRSGMREATMSSARYNDIRWLNQALCPAEPTTVQRAPARTGRNGQILAALGRLLLVAALMGVMLGPAAADFRVCNKTGRQVDVAIGYKDAAEGWVTRGWWNLSAHSCETLGHGYLDRRYYFIYAANNDIVWSGDKFMCTHNGKFAIRGFNDCRARGYDKTGFHEIDVGDNRSFTFELTE
jgi:uncharacterized membrane protein